MNKNIINLSKIFIKDSLSRFDIYNFNKKKINVKNGFFWLFIVLIIALSLITYKIMEFFNQINQPKIFLNIFLMGYSLISIFQIIIFCSNNLYFSNDLKTILQFPLKPKEIMISKIIAIIVNMYLSEIIFFIFPMIIFGIMAYGDILYYFNLLIVFIIFPILPVLLISIIMSFFVKLSKFIKNKNSFQIIITTIFILTIIFGEYKITSSMEPNDTKQVTTEAVSNYVLNLNDKTKNINKFFIQINDISYFLTNRNFKSFFHFLKIIVLNIIAYYILIFLCNKYYIKDLLRNNNYIKVKKIKKNKLVHKYKKQKKELTYLIKEFKVLFRNPTFFIQCIFPNLILVFTVILCASSFAPQFRYLLQWDLIHEKVEIKYDIQMVNLILIVIQMILCTSNIAITGISREGKKWILMKNMPIKLYNQFQCKAYTQVLFNNIVLIAITVFIGKIFYELNILDLCILLVLFILMNVINSKIALLIDLINPNLNWDAEYEINKNNKNKIYQYSFTVIMVLITSYLSKILKNINIYYAYLFISLLFLLIIFNINFIVKINIEKLFNKIKTEK